MNDNEDEVDVDLEDMEDVEDTEDVEDVEDTEDLFELHVADTDVSSGTIAVSWCLSKDMIQNLATKGLWDPLRQT